MFSLLVTYLKEYLQVSKNVTFWILYIRFLMIVITVRYGFHVDFYFTKIIFGFVIKALTYPLLLGNLIGLLRITKLNETIF